MKDPLIQSFQSKTPIRLKRPATTSNLMISGTPLDLDWSKNKTRQDIEYEDTKSSQIPKIPKTPKSPYIKDKNFIPQNFKFSKLTNSKNNEFMSIQNISIVSGIKIEKLLGLPVHSDKEESYSPKLKLRIKLPLAESQIQSKLSGTPSSHSKAPSLSQFSPKSSGKSSYQSKKMLTRTSSLVDYYAGLKDKYENIKLFKS